MEHTVLPFEGYEAHCGPVQPLDGQPLPTLGSPSLMSYYPPILLLSVQTCSTDFKHFI